MARKRRALKTFPMNLSKKLTQFVNIFNGKKQICLESPPLSSQ